MKVHLEDFENKINIDENSQPQGGQGGDDQNDPEIEN
jgi:hypothetical protein